MASSAASCERPSRALELMIAMVFAPLVASLNSNISVRNARIFSLRGLSASWAKISCGPGLTCSPCARTICLLEATLRIADSMKLGFSWMVSLCVRTKVSANLFLSHETKSQRSLDESSLACAASVARRRTAVLRISQSAPTVPRADHPRERRSCGSGGEFDRVKFTQHRYPETTLEVVPATTRRLTTIS